MADRKPKVQDWNVEVAFARAAGTRTYDAVERVWTCRVCGLKVSRKKSAKLRVWQLDRWNHRACVEG